MTTPSPGSWVSYDSVADIYERVAVPRFRALAEHLVAAVAPQPGERVLDVGTGTGLAASAAMKMCPRLHVVGVDPSTAMLARVPSSVRRVAGMAPGLPFAPRSFDAAFANLALSHLPDLEGGMADVVRAIRPGGRFGCTVWAEAEPGGPGNDRGRADAIVSDVRAALDLDARVPTDAAPWEEVLKDPRRLEAVLIGGGLADIEIAIHRLTWSLTVDEYLSGSGWGGTGRYLRHAYGAPAWERFVQQASAALRRELGERIELVGVAWLGTGRR